MTALLLAALVLAAPPGETRPSTEILSGRVPPARLIKLTRGINLSDWFTQPPDDPERHLDPNNMAKDVALIKAMGFRHVRLAFGDATVVDPQTPAVLNPEKMKRFDAALDMLLAADLAVVVDFSPGHDYKRAIEKDDAAVENFVGLWRVLAKHLASRDPEMVFFELLNEPVMTDSARWNVIQKKALAAMRESAPRHTLIATSAEWSECYKLELVEVVADRNVVYNVHYYDPVRFTHQDAPWVGDWVKGLRNAPYPSSPEAVAKVLDGLPDDTARKLMINYGKEKWDAAKIEEILAEGAAWGKKQGVAMTCNEFGVYRKAPAADRNRCIEDTRKAMEKFDIGWCMWDYAGDFGVATGKPGQRVADADTLKALGLMSEKPKSRSPLPKGGRKFRNSLKERKGY
ncbi:MAG: cellulase family glycosylhydrolase [Planctomycetota bacterium]